MQKVNGVNTLKKYLLWSLFISIFLYFASSFAFPVLGERIVVPIMIICIVIGGMSLLGLIIVIIKQKSKK